MSVVRWGRDRATASVDPMAVDELDGAVLVLDGVTSDDDPLLGWCRRAPCPVIARPPDGIEAPRAVDLVADGSQGGGGPDDDLDRLVAAAEANPQATRALLDVVRAVPSCDTSTGLTLESLAYSLLLGGSEFARWLGDHPPPAPAPPVAAPVRFERDGGELRLALAHPERRNAFSAPMRDALVEALWTVELDPSIERVVLAGDGPVFCSGGDLAEFGENDDLVRAHQVRRSRSVASLLDRHRATLTVEMQGACVGAGVELAAFAAHVVAAGDTTFRLPEIGMGLVPGAGGTVSVTRRIGRQAAAKLAVTGAPIDAATALALGLVDEVR